MKEIDTKWMNMKFICTDNGYEVDFSIRFFTSFIDILGLTISRREKNFAKNYNEEWSLESLF